MPRPKRCKSCGKTYTPTSPLQKVCSLQCAIALAQKKRAKEESKAHCEALKRIKTKAQWMREAQAACNAYIRARDEGKPCISCDRHHTGQIHAGHYRTTKAAPELRFHPDNIHAQCSACNNHLSGNITAYRPRLIEKVGLPMVEWIERDHGAYRYSIDDLQEIKRYYTEATKFIKRERDGVE